MIAFRKVKAPYGWLSNMSPHPIGRYRTAEALFQAMRFNDSAVIEEILAQKSPMAAKMVAKANADKMVIQPRSRQDLANMQVLLEAKLAAHPELKKALLDTGDEEIIEDVTSRPNDSGLFWGAALKDGVWVGQNTLGKLWMLVREELRKKSE